MADWHDAANMTELRATRAKQLSGPVVAEVAVLDLMQVPAPPKASAAPDWHPWQCENRTFLGMTLCV